MKAWISRIELTNFKCYEKAEFNFPELQENGNLVLIGALNGHGKTTFMEALFLGLYGERGIETLKRAVHHTGEVNPDKLIEQALSLTAKEKFKNDLISPSQGTYAYQLKNKLLTIKIEIEISYKEKEEVNSLTVRRVWGFKYDEKAEDFKLQKNSFDHWFCQTINKEQNFLDEGEFLSKVSLYAPNYLHARFFFFDGEKLADIADKNKFIMSGLQDLIGITLLDNESEGKKGIKQSVIERLDKVIRASKKSQEAEQNLTEKERELEQKNAEINHKEQELSDIEIRIADNEKEENRLMSFLGDASIKSTDELLKDKEIFEQDSKKLEEQINTILKEFPLYFLTKSSITAFKRKMEAEYKRIQLENNRKRLSPKLKRFIENFNMELESLQEQKANENMADKSLAIFENDIEQAIKKAWHSLFYPLSADEAEFITHNYLSETNHQDIKTTMELRKTKALDNIDELLKSSEEKEDKLTEIQEDLDQARRENRDEYKKQYDEIKEQTKEDNHIKGALSNEIDRLKKEKQNIELDIDNLKKEISDDNEEARKLQKIKDAIELLKERLFEEKKGTLKVNTLEIYQQISHDERVKSIYIEGEKIEFLDRNKDEVIASSAGETQLQLTALSLALSKSTGFLSPMVIDTPLARLDAQNRSLLLDYLASLPQQVILLAQDGEINYEQAQDLLDDEKVIKTFMVKSREFNTGRIATVEEDIYFAE